VARTKTYFIDVENVGSKHIENFLKQDKSSTAVIVTGRQSNFKASGAILEELSKGKTSRIDVIHSDISRDQLADKLLLIKVGEFRGRYPSRQLIIVSKDNGFSDAANIMNDHWGSDIKVINSLPVGGAKKVQPAKKTHPQKKAQPAKKTQPPKKSQKPIKGGAQKYWEIVSKRSPRNRAKTLDALKASISNIGKTGIDAQPDKVVNYLKSTGIISVKNTKVTWLKE